MGLKLYNTLTGTKEDFIPFEPANVRMYVCGPTVYDFAHIGNARPLIVFDVLFRLLRHLYGEAHVTYVRNITDVDDKINARAARDFPALPLNEAIRKVTEATEKQFHADVAALGCLPPTHEPRATEFISRSDMPEDMIRLIGRLIEKGHAYPAEGHVLFEVAKDRDYGKLAHRSLDDMLAGARVDIAPYKKDPMDFVLWKPSKPGEPAWPSPWGDGRPGWHIECSAMAGALLGPTFDIHGGGIDLVFPHHENELAQSRCAHGTNLLARYWMHNGFLQVEGKKMAKSEGNFVTIRELLAGWHRRMWSGRAARLAMLTAHYRQPIDWTYDRLLQAAADLALYSQILHPVNFTDDYSIRLAWESSPQPDDDFQSALLDDLNTPLALKVVRDIAKEAEEGTDSVRIKLAHTLRFLGVFEKSILLSHSAGILNTAWGGAPGEKLNKAMVLSRSLQIYLANGDQPNVDRISAGLQSLGFRRANNEFGAADIEYVGQRDDRIESMISERAAARKAKNFGEADRIRDELDAMGIQLKDSKDPKTGELVTIWEVKR